MKKKGKNADLNHYDHFKINEAGIILIKNRQHDTLLIFQRIKCDNYP